MVVVAIGADVLNAVENCLSGPQPRRSARIDARLIRDQLVAGVAQLVEQLICNQQVVGSSQTVSSINKGRHPFMAILLCGGMPAATIGSLSLSLRGYTHA